MRKGVFKGYCVRFFCEKVCGVMLPIDCFAILLVIDPMMGFVFLCSSLWWVGEFDLSHENTCSEYRIRPQNTPRKIESLKNKTKMSCANKSLHELHLPRIFVIFLRLSIFLGEFWVRMRYSLLPPPTPQKFPFFPDFSLIFRDFWDFAY